MAIEIRLSAYDKEAGACSGIVWTGKQTIAFEATRVPGKEFWQKIWLPSFSRRLDPIARNLADHCLNVALSQPTGPQVNLDKYPIPIFSLTRCSLPRGQRRKREIEFTMLCLPPFSDGRRRLTGDQQRSYRVEYRWLNGNRASESGLHPETWPDDEDIDAAINALLEHSRGRLPIVLIPQNI